MLRKKINLKKKYSKSDLRKILSIDYDFLILDEFKLINNFKQAIGLVKYNKSKHYFNSHFLNKPTMPGTLQTEAMLQAIVSIIFLSDLNIKKCLITKYNVSFLDKIDKPTNLIVKANIKSIKRGLVTASATLENNKNKKYSYGEFNFIIPDKFKLKN